MEKPAKNNGITGKVMDEIKAGKIKARPRLFFTLKTAIYFILISLSFCLAVFLASFVAFALQVNEMSYLLLILSIWAFLSTAFGVFLAKKFSFFYKKPLAVGLAFFIVAVAGISILVLRTAFHSTLLERSQRNEWPVISPLYRSGCGCEAAGLCGQHDCPCSGNKIKP
ncbi:MAG: hypothetical protein PHU56_03720 [Candidatus Pacebacteria bacterium]|nr:hypothetical protein [Candidatus Paceibacterota bacterium]